MREPDTLQRRQILTGNLNQDSRAEQRFTHISSAIVTARPENAGAVADRIAGMPGIQVHAVQGAKIILVLEGRSVGEVGGRLAEISVMDGVFSANLVFEQILPLDENGAQS